MDKNIRWAGIALVIGAVLMFTRMVPIFTVLPDDMAFPPVSTEKMVDLWKIAGSRWQLSHVMGLVAVVLFATGYGLFARILVLYGWTRLGPTVGVVAIVSFALFGAALIVDGFMVPAVIEHHVSVASGNAPTLEQVATTHAMALRFFTPGVFLMFVATGLLSAPMVHRHLHARWQGLLGQAIAIAAVTAYFFGATGPNWDELQVAGALMMAAFAWHLLVGARAIVAR